MDIRQILSIDLSFATNLISNNISMRVLEPNLEDFGPKLEENKPFEFLKKNVSLVFHRPSTLLLFYWNRKDFSKFTKPTTVRCKQIHKSKISCDREREVNIRCVFLKHKRNFKKDKVETVIVLATKISRSHMCSFNVQLMQSKLSYYKIRSGAKYLCT